MKKNIGVIGLWHLGCTIAASWAKLGYKVKGFDFDAARTEKLNKGIPQIYEPYLKETIEDSLKNNTLSFTANIQDLKDSDFIFLAYDTPVRDDDSCDTDILLNSIRSVRYVAKNESIIIVSSQSPVGFCAELRNILHETNNSIELAYSPENLRLGEAINCYLNPGRIILGTASAKTEEDCCRLFNDITKNILCMNLESAEMVKHGINSFLATSIVFTNHLADICEKYGAQIDNVVKGMKSDERIGAKAYLSAGTGFSGGTLGRDLKILSEKNDQIKGYAKLFKMILNFNKERKQSIISKIESILGDLGSKKIGVLGLTYKPNTSTLRRSLPLEIVTGLMRKKASLCVYDPKADYSELSYQPEFIKKHSIKDLSLKADLLLLLTEWPEFGEFDWSSIIDLMSSPNFFDTKNYLNEAKMKRIGFKYYSIGRFHSDPEG